jgi:hypothetical protein
MPSSYGQLWSSAATSVRLAMPSVLPARLARLLEQDLFRPPVERSCVTTTALDAPPPDSWKHCEALRVRVVRDARQSVPARKRLREPLMKLALRKGQDAVRRRRASLLMISSVRRRVQLCAIHSDGRREALSSSQQNGTYNTRPARI